MVLGKKNDDDKDDIGSDGCCTRTIFGNAEVWEILATLIFQVMFSIKNFVFFVFLINDIRAHFRPYPYEKAFLSHQDMQVDV